MEGLIAGKILSAASFAAHAHVNQRRKNKEAAPYINHPLKVACALADAGVTDTDVLCAAILHDTVEDTGTSPETLEAHFGSRVASIVKECSDDKSKPKVERKRLQIEHIKDASESARLVKLADKLDNLSNLLADPPLDWSPAVVKGYALWSFAVIRASPIFPTQAEASMRLIGALTRVLERLGVNINDGPEQGDLEAYYALI
jgi:guanosine-3',5'-bis(diphosphate) 3'-pyrophosphohydrolase